MDLTDETAGVNVKLGVAEGSVQSGQLSKGLSTMAEYVGFNFDKL